MQKCHNNMIEHYNNITKCSRPYDPLQVLYYPKQSTLYVVSQKVNHDIKGYCIMFMMQFVNRNDAIVHWVIFKKNLATIKSALYKVLPYL